MMQGDKMGPGRRFHDTVVVKGTFELRPGILGPSGLQAPVTLADQYWDPACAERSSLKAAGEVLLAKPGTDLVVTGTARAPGRRPVRRWDAAVVVRDARATLLSHALVATGPRQWEHRGLRGWRLSDPSPAAEVPIRYELAYGGAYQEPERRSDPAERRWHVFGANPSGTGFFDPAEIDRGRSHRGPQWEDRLHPVTAINCELPLAGFGPVARWWSSRLRHAGTCDAAWEEKARRDMEQGLPADYPADFDMRFFQCAHPALIVPGHLQGDEQIGMSGLTGDASPFLTRLPGISLLAALLDGSGTWHEQRMALDTMHVDLDTARVHLCWRLTLDQEQDVHTALILPEQHG